MDVATVALAPLVLEPLILCQLGLAPTTTTTTTAIMTVLDDGFGATKEVNLEDDDVGFTYSYVGLLRRLIPLTLS